MYTLVSLIARVHVYMWKVCGALTDDDDDDYDDAAGWSGPTDNATISVQRGTRSRCILHTREIRCLFFPSLFPSVLVPVSLITIFLSLCVFKLSIVTV